MNNSDTQRIQGEDIWVALGLLTRLPLPHRTWDQTRPAAHAAWAYPLVGLIIGGLACLLGTVFVWLGLPTGVTAAALLLCMTLLTGAMHEDGLADSADGFWGGDTPARRLDIMKDSHIGAYGVIALIAGFTLRWSALSALITAGYLWAPMLVAAITSRAAMAYVMNALPNARQTGLSSMTGRPGTIATRIAIGLGVLACVAGFGLAGVWAILCAIAATAFCSTLAKRKIGGQTGDILGATQQVIEIVILATACTLIL